MLLPQILLLAGLSLATGFGLLRFTRSNEPRAWIIFGASVVCLYWLQPNTAIRYLDFWLPTAVLGLGALGWLLTAPPEARWTRPNLLAGAALAGLVLLAGLIRYLGVDVLDIRPPAFAQVGPAVGLAALLLAGLGLALRGKPAPGWLLWLAIAVLMGLLVLLKTPALAKLAAGSLRGWMGQNPALADALDIRWLGFSYISFRLIHTLRDRQSGRLPESGLRAYLSYLIFFPALAAGPIDRLERFQQDYAAGPETVSVQRRAEDLTEAARRLALGLFKKFALADTLALVALSPLNAGQVRGAGWLWLLLYAYALLIYLDFSGYTDIAIGLGRLWGVRLPENFDKPYLRPNLTQFWNNWHMTLTQWFRAYYFNPLVRWLRGPRFRLQPGAVLLLSQVTTFFLIGMWHGVSWNFAIWGLWHGLGLFAQNRWSEFARGRFANLPPGRARVLRGLSTALTFHYVALGWVWFTLPTPGAALRVLGRLFGLEVVP